MSPPAAVIAARRSPHPSGAGRCIYKGSGPGSNGGEVWCSGGHGPVGTYSTILQDDGNLCTYPGTLAADELRSPQASWCSGSPVCVGKTCQLWASLGDDGRFCIHHGSSCSSAPAGPAVWCSPADKDDVAAKTTDEEAAPLTITDFWEGRAHFELISKSAFPEYGMRSMNVGFQFVTRPGGVWYLFHREYNFAPRPHYCIADWARIVVRKSTTQGRNWSNATVIATPSGPFPNSGNDTATPRAPDECALTDGAGYYDESAGIWHYCK